MTGPPPLTYPSQHLLNPTPFLSALSLSLSSHYRRPLKAEKETKKKTKKVDEDDDDRHGRDDGDGDRSRWTRRSRRQYLKKNNQIGLLKSGDRFRRVGHIFLAIFFWSRSLLEKKRATTPSSERIVNSLQLFIETRVDWR